MNTNIKALSNEELELISGGADKNETVIEVSKIVSKTLIVAATFVFVYFLGSSIAKGIAEIGKNKAPTR